MLDVGRLDFKQNTMTSIIMLIQMLPNLCHFGSISAVNFHVKIELKTLFIINQHNFNKKQKANVILVFVEIIISI